VPEDRSDEVNAQWAPRGNKVSFILHTSGGDLVRTVHVPTATPLTVDFPRAQVDALAWDTAGARFAVVVESPDASQRLLSMTYEGEKRQELLAAAEKLDVELEPIAGGVLLRPAALRYNEKLPLVVWVDPKPFRWSDERAALLRSARVAIAIAPDADTALRNVASTPWIDGAKTYIVAGEATPQSTSPATIIRAGRSLAPHTYVRRGAVVEAPAAVVQSFAAAFIADDLKGSPPPHGRR
jgi:hypothetical protein